MATSAGPSFFAFLMLCICVTLAKNVDTRLKRQADLEQKSCDSVTPFFQSKNITVSAFNDKKGNICGGHCCDSETELLLKEQGRKDFATLLRHNSRSLLGPINRTAAILQNHVWELANQSENKTLLLFSQVYRSMSVLSREPIELLYRDIQDYVRIDSSNQKPTKTPEDIVKTVERFFTDLFPLAYHQQTGLSSGDFTAKYKQCLKDNMDVIVPFGDFPKEVAQSLSKSLEATRLLLQAFSIGVEVLNTTDTLIIDEHSSTSSECHSALLKMTYCPKCLGLTKNSKPCSGYCLNVLRGCISKYVAELDLPWNSYVEGIESLVNALKRTSNDAGVNVDLAIRNLDGQISSAIMYCMEKIVEIDKKVKMTCKIPEFSQKVESLTAEITTIASAIAKARQPSSRTFPHFPDAHMTSFLSTMSKTKGFYADLADNLCGDESFAEQRDKKCWNGERIAEYTKTIVGVAVNMQKYNPEVKAAPNLQQVDPKIATLVDKLRHVHHMAISSLGPNYAETDYMQRDGVDGSGSGNGPDFDADDDEYSRGSGSGNGPIETDENFDKRWNNEPMLESSSSWDDLPEKTVENKILTQYEGEDFNEENSDKKWNNESTLESSSSWDDLAEKTVENKTLTQYEGEDFYEENSDKKLNNEPTPTLESSSSWDDLADKTVKNKTPIQYEGKDFNERETQVQEPEINSNESNINPDMSNHPKEKPMCSRPLIQSPINSKTQPTNIESCDVIEYLKSASNALNNLTCSSQFRQAQDEIGLYSQLLAEKLRKMSLRTRLILQNKIDNLVFETVLPEIEPYFETPPAS